MRKALHKVEIRWSPHFAYAIGLITSDGSLSVDGRHISVTSKDYGLIKNFKRTLGLSNKVGRKARKRGSPKKYFVIQFGDISFYKFLVAIGLMPDKSKRLRGLNISDQYFFHFLRGYFDGDGTFYSYWDPRWKSSFMLYCEFVSSSKEYIDWLRGKINAFLNIQGHIGRDGEKSTYQLKYAKTESLRLLERLYKDNDLIFLNRKYQKIRRDLALINKQNLV